MAKDKYRMQIGTILSVSLTYILVSLLIYVTKGPSIFWSLYAVPAAIAAFAYGIAGGLALGLLGALSIAGWAFYFGADFAPAAANLTPRVTEIAIGFALYLALSLALGYLMQLYRTQRSLLEGLSIEDQLTGLCNYSYFVNKLSDERIRSDRYGNIFSLIMIDIDSFKTFNETRTAEAGNDVLRRIGEIVSTSVRNVDTVCRYGGEEFAVLLPYAFGSEALTVAERIRATIAKEQFVPPELSEENQEAEPVITVSCGVASYPTDARNETELIINADRALYQAKAAGRNRVSVFAKSDTKQDQKLIKH